MDQNPRPTINIIAKGSAPSTFIGATFKAMVTTYGPNGPDAKAKAKPTIERIREVLTKLGTEAGVVKDRLKTSFAVSTNQNRNTGMFDGYKAVYTIEFTATNVIAAIALHDGLTSIPAVEANTPIFNIDKGLAVQTAAFQNAVDNAQKLWDAQARALKITPDSYAVESWVIHEPDHYGERGGKMLSIREPEEGGPITVEPGAAIHDLKVTFIYSKRPNFH